MRERTFSLGLTRLAWIASTLLAGEGLRPAALAAQDLEVVSRQAGIPLPPGYWARTEADPLTFELPNGFFGPREALPPVRAPGLVAQPVQHAFEGVARFPVLLALFADSPDPWVSPDDLAASLFTGPSPRGTLTEFYSEASYGRFTVQGDVLPWLRTSLTISEVVGTEFGLGEDARVGAYLRETLTLADETVDFTIYDNDGPDGVPNSGDDDGIVDLVTFEFLEVAASCGGPGIWPHRSGMSRRNDGQPWPTQDIGADGMPVKVDAYIIQGATDCSGTRIQTAATIAHEFGHALGLRDYYHPVNGITPENRRWVLGCWDLMAAGAWGCGPVGSTRSDFGPTHLSAWNRHILGWLDFVELGPVRDTVLEIGPVRTGGEAIRVPLGESEVAGWLVVEYRDKGGCDRDLPGPGVLVTRIDPGGEFRPQEGYRYFASILEADGDSALMRTLAEGGDRGAPSDVFGPTRRRLNLQTHPSTASPGTGTSTVAFHEITLTEAGARLRISTHPQPALTAPGTPVAAAAGVPVDAVLVMVAGGTLPVTVTERAGLPPGLTLQSEEDRLRLTGNPLAEGAFTVQVAVRDAVGLVAAGSLGIEVGPFSMEAARLAEAILGGTSLTEGEVEYLDANGNANGNLDVGDLRAWRYGGGG